MNEIIKLKCPNCNAVLNVKNAAGQDEKVITCPRCKVSNRIKDFHGVTIQKKVQADEKTELDLPTMLNPSRSEVVDNVADYYLLDMHTGKRYVVKKGKNLVGRMTTSSPSIADVRIETQDMGFSRAHFYIEVLSVGSQVKVFLSNARNKNQTYVNSDLVEAGDKLVLHNGDVILSSETTLKFIAE